MFEISKSLIVRAAREAIALGASENDVIDALQSAKSVILSDSEVKKYAATITFIESWLSGCTDRIAGEIVPSSVLYNSYQNFGGMLTKQAFGRMLSFHGFIRKTKADGSYWLGLRLKGQSVEADLDNWIGEQCVIDLRASLSSKDLHASYITWTKLAPISKQRFNGLLADRGYVKQGFVWRGLTTKAALVTARQQLQELQK